MTTNKDIKYYEYFDNVRKCKAVKAVTHYAGSPVFAIAYTSPDEEVYDVETGKKLALARLNKKLCEKRVYAMKRKAKHYAEMIEAAKALQARFERELANTHKSQALREAELAETSETLETLLAKLM